MSVSPLPATRRFFLIATEESGDRLGAHLMRELRQRLGSAEFQGVGGRMMASEGLASLFPIEQLSIIGLAAIARQFPAILRLIRQTSEAVIKASPDALVIIDSPEFTHRVAKRVRARAPEIAVIDYVSPSVWAWRSGRAAAMRGYVDHVLALLPFEPEEYRKLKGPPCSYVGHPLIEQLSELRPDVDERRRRDGQPPVLLVLPGSRRSEVRHHMKIFGETLARLRAAGHAFEAVLPTMPHLQEAIDEALEKWPVRPKVVIGEDAKRSAFRIAHAALAKSGTVTLELALAQVPMVAAYRGGALEAWIVLRAIRARSFILANLVIGDNVVPEFIQQDCKAENLASALARLLIGGRERNRQLEAFARLDSIMSTGERSPSERAADIVLSLLPPSKTG